MFIDYQAAQKQINVLGKIHVVTALRVNIFCLTSFYGTIKSVKNHFFSNFASTQAGANIVSPDTRVLAQSRST